MLPKGHLGNKNIIFLFRLKTLQDLSSFIFDGVISRLIHFSCFVLKFCAQDLKKKKKL